MAFSLPSLKPLLDIDFLPLNDVRIARTFCFSSNGHASYLCSATEIQKITFSADMRLVFTREFEYVQFINLLAL
jgi:syntaxin-binding protein 5